MKDMSKALLLCVLFFSTGIEAQYNSNQPGMLQSTASGLLNGATVFTIEFWVKTTDNRSNNVYWQRPYLFGNETAGDNSGDFGITLNNGYIGMFEGISNLNTDQQFLSTSVRINDNFFHHIAAVNNGQTVNLYVDGNIVGSLVTGRALNTMAAPLTFGGASLDHAFASNSSGNKNFISQASFGDARISNTVRYSGNFTPSQSLSSDANVLAAYHFDGSGYASQPMNPNTPVTFLPEEPINSKAAQPATLFLKDSSHLFGRLLLGKKDWSFSNEIYIRFYEGSSTKVKYYKPEEVLCFQMGDSWYEPKFLGSGPVNTPFNKTMVKRLTPPGSRMAMYEYDAHTLTKNSNGSFEVKYITAYFVQLPHTNDDKVYQFSDNKFVPKFDAKVSAIVADKPALAEKIMSKNKDYFYAFVTEDTHQYKVWWNIVNEYNQ